MKLLLKAACLVLLTACATLRGMSEDLKNMGRGLEQTISEHESKRSPASSSSQGQSSTAEVSTAEIREAQKRLAVAGFDPGPIDGVLGPKTQAALREFQAKNGLPVTGVIDEQTRKAIGL